MGCPPRPENLFYALLKLQDKIDTMTISKRPTEVRLNENMMDQFKRNICIAQDNAAINPEAHAKEILNGQSKGAGA
jgi:NADH-quinone oxidoreductase subunit B